MPQRWLQIKGDPSVRQFMFSQERQVSLFDTHLERLHQIVEILLTEKDAFHVKIHYSSSQLTCWYYDEPYHYRVYVLDEVFDPGFLGSLPNMSYEGRRPLIGKECIDRVLGEFKRLRFSDQQAYLRSASLNRINGMIGMTFSCDGSHYLDYEQFFDKLEAFGYENRPLNS